MDSILTTVKKMLGIEEDYTDYDVDIIIHINSALNILTQMGVGPKEGFAINSKEETWDQFLDGEENKVLLNDVKTYMYLKVKKYFDPLTGSAGSSLDECIAELEWRINSTADIEVQKHD